MACPGRPRDRVEAYLASEQALVAGHRFHPSPKTRPGHDWLRYTPEAGARFPLRFLAVRADVLADDGDSSGLDRLGGPVPPNGYGVLPAHPWQLRLLADQPCQRQILSEALRRELLIDLGDGDREVVPTSSVRTVYDPVADVFCKFSLNVRITNCVRKSAWYELAGSVALTRLLAPVFAELGRRFPGTVLLGEPGYRTVALASRDAYEGLSVIVRDGVRARTAPGRDAAARRVADRTGRPAVRRAGLRLAGRLVAGLRPAGRAAGPGRLLRARRGARAAPAERADRRGRRRLARPGALPRSGGHQARLVPARRGCWPGCRPGWPAAWPTTPGAAGTGWPTACSSTTWPRSRRPSPTGARARPDVRAGAVAPGRGTC